MKKAWENNNKGEMTCLYKIELLHLIEFATFFYQRIVCVSNFLISTNKGKKWTNEMGIFKLKIDEKCSRK